ncbi:MAG: XRE family transcriptional regulator [Bacteroidetes bacterium 38_7]|nr:MAG: XRE family transcriptional regulator [Bacteroidetes bacterium 38_7]HAL64650.1 XRE family transcriptional regulator [Bacteroidales bacterium]
MTLGEHIMLLRKQKELSQAALGKSIGTSGDIIGRYERNIMTPSIDVIVKIADTLGVSIDYLVGKTNIELDRNTLKRPEDINTLSDENKSFIFRMIDMALRDLKTGQAYATK